MPRIDADHPEHTVPANDLAFLTAASYWCRYLHGSFLFSLSAENRLFYDSCVCLRRTWIAHASGVRRTHYS